MLLLLCGMALAGVTLYRMLDGLLAFGWPLAAALGLGGAGAELLLRCDRWIFDTASRTIFFKRPFRRTVGWDFSAIAQVERVAAPGGQADAELIFKSGGRAFLARGSGAEIEAGCGRVADLLGVVGVDRKQPVTSA